MNPLRLKFSQGIPALLDWILSGEAAERNSNETAKYLLAKGAIANLKNADGETPLHLVLDREIAELLIANGAEVNAMTNQGLTPLLAQVLSPKIFGSAQVTSSDGRILSDVLAEKSVETARLLIANGAEVNVKGDEDVTPLLAATAINNTEMVNLLISHGADVQAKTKDGRSTLQFACAAGNKLLIQVFLEKGVDIQGKDNDGSTALHRVSIEGNKEIAQLLLEKGADLNAKNNEGKTPLDVAKNLKFADFLRKIAGSINIQSKPRS